MVCFVVVLTSHDRVIVGGPLVRGSLARVLEVDDENIRGSGRCARGKDGCEEHHSGSVVDLRKTEASGTFEILRISEYPWI